MKPTSKAFQPVPAPHVPHRRAPLLQTRLGDASGTSIVQIRCMDVCVACLCMKIAHVCACPPPILAKVHISSRPQPLVAERGAPGVGAWRPWGFPSERRARSSDSAGAHSHTPAASKRERAPRLATPAGSDRGCAAKGVPRVLLNGMSHNGVESGPPEVKGGVRSEQISKRIGLLSAGACADSMACPGPRGCGPCRPHGISRPGCPIAEGLWVAELLCGLRRLHCFP